MEGKKREGAVSIRDEGKIEYWDRPARVSTSEIMKEEGKRVFAESELLARGRGKGGEEADR